VAISIAIAVEDSLSECVVRRLIPHTRRDITIGECYPLKTLPGGRSNPKNRRGKRGFSGWGQLKINLPAFNEAARTGTPFMVLTDLDVHVKCPGELLQKWLGKTRHSQNLIFRVAVKEVEAWLLADTSNFASYLAIEENKISKAVESLSDPKLEIVALAKQSASPQILEDMVPKKGSMAEVGRCFDRMLINFVRHQWDIDEACKNAHSLSKAIHALKSFKPK